MEDNNQAQMAIDNFEKELFARCITGYKYSENNLLNSIYNCIITLLNSKVIDVDRLDYLIRDAYFTGFETVNIDYARLLSSLTIVIRDNNTSKYIELISLLSGYLDVNDNDEEYLYLPDIYFVKDGKIVSHNNDMATNSTDDILGDEDDSKIKDKYIKLLNEYFEKDTSE